MFTCMQFVCFGWAYVLVVAVVANQFGFSCVSQSVRHLSLNETHRYIHYAPTETKQTRALYTARSGGKQKKKKKTQL